MMNPFTPSLMPSRLFGRDSELSDARAHILNGGHYAISGIAGCGKTAFLRALEDPTSWLPQGSKASGGFAVYYDLSNLQPFQPADFWAGVRDELAAKLSPYDPLHNTITSSEASAKGFEACCKALRGRNQRILLLLDGYDNAAAAYQSYSDQHVLKHLFETRRLAQAKCFATVAATYRRLSDLGPPADKLPGGESPWYNQYLFQPIGNISEADLDPHYALLAPLQLSSVWRNAIQGLCGGSPALHQHAGHILYDSVATRTLPPIKDFCDKLESATRHYYKRWWEGANSAERLLMKLAAVSDLQNRRDLGRDYDLSDVPVIFSQNDRHLREMCERGILRKTGGVAYGFCSSLMESWVLKEVENTPAAEAFGDREKEILNLSKVQVKKINSILSKAWQHKDAIKSWLSWAAARFTLGPASP